MTMRRNCPTYGRFWTVIRKLTIFRLPIKNITAAVNLPAGIKGTIRPLSARHPHATYDRHAACTRNPYFRPCADIIFLTTSSDFAVESYTVKATNYLMKPVSSNAFFAAMDDILRAKTQEQGHFLVLKSRIGVHKVPLSELIYVEAQNRKVIYYTSGREQIVCTELFSSVCDSLLQHREFIQVHRSFLVNMNYIRSIGTMDMCLHNGTNVPLAQRRVADIKKHYLAFQMEE